MIDNGITFEDEIPIKSTGQLNGGTTLHLEHSLNPNKADNPQEGKIVALGNIPKVIITDNVDSCYQLNQWINEIQHIQGNLHTLLEQFQKIKDNKSPNLFFSNQIDSKGVQDSLDVIGNQIDQLMNKCTHQQGVQKTSVINPFFTLDDQLINQAQISPDEMHVAYSVQLKYIKIYSLQEKQLEQEIKTTNNITQFQFSQNSKILFIGCQNGQLLIQNLYQKNRNRVVQISNQLVNNIIQINPNMVMASCNSQVRLLNLNNMKKYSNINVHSTQKQLQAYDARNNILINCKSDKSIQFYNLNNRNPLFIQQNTHDKTIIQTQFINQTNQLFTLDLSGLLKLWQISYGQKSMTELRSFQDQIQIQNFTYQYDINQLMILNQKQIKIINKDDYSIIEHNIKQLSTIFIYIRNSLREYILRQVKLFIYFGEQQILFILLEQFHVYKK